MQLVIDLHIHGKYSRATSQSLSFDELAKWGKIKGLNVIGTGDFTHPKWFSELKKAEEKDGLLLYNGMAFMLSVEVSNIFEKNGKVYRIHNVILTDSLDAAAQIADYLSRYGNLVEDGRPTLKLSPAEMIEGIGEVSPNAEVFAAHVWTPWYSLFGSRSGGDSVEEVFEDKAKKLLAVETGLSSDPAMNWLVPDTRKYPIISNSDAHSARNLGREATVIEASALSYNAIITGIREGIIMTYEFNPKEGKYHYDGHRKCGVCLHPQEAEKLGNKCPVCGKTLTIGVLHRVLQLADKKEGFRPKDAKPFRYIIPLHKALAKILNTSEYSRRVEETYFKLIRYFGSELNVYDASLEELKLAVGGIAEKLYTVLQHKVKWKPGYDGVYGDFYLEQKQLTLNMF